MTKKEIDTHIKNWKEVEVDNASGMFTQAEIRNFKFCNIWFLISPILKFLSKNFFVRWLRPGWVVAINIALEGLDELCNLKN